MMSNLPENHVCEQLIAQQQTLATAESCSGGLIAHRLTNVAGSSAFFLGGIVAYANTAKMALLGVSEELLIEHGAVSEPVVKAMAEGVQHRFQSDYALACSGIAGPGGGTAEKPVGLVFIALARPGAPTVVLRNEFMGPREAVKTQTAERAIALLLEYIA